MPTVRMTRRQLTVALLASPVALTLGRSAAAQEATPAGSPTPASARYLSDQFGYQINCPDDWTLVTTEAETGGYDMVQLARGDARAYLILSRPGDTPLSEIAEFMVAGPPSEETFVPGMVESDAAGERIQGDTGDRAWVAYAGNLAGEDVDGFTQFRYGEVRRLEPDLAIALSLAMPAGDFDKEIESYSALLDGVTKVDGTPAAG